MWQFTISSLKSCQNPISSLKSCTNDATLFESGQNKAPKKCAWKRMNSSGRDRMLWAWHHVARKLAHIGIIYGCKMPFEIGCQISSPDFELEIRPCQISSLKYGFTRRHALGLKYDHWAWNVILSRFQAWNVYCRLIAWNIHTYKYVMGLKCNIVKISSLK